MLELLAQYLEPVFGPFRLMGSHLVRIGLGAGLAALAVWWLLPKLAGRLPLDRGREHAVGAGRSKGKPTGAGIIMFLAILPVLFLVMPPGIKYWQVIGCLMLAMLTGWFDDRSERPWGEYRKGLLDLGICVLCGMALCQMAPVTLWLPLVKGGFVLPAPLFVAVAAVLLWLAINATNCSDGVDGLAGTLSLLSLFYLGSFLYIVAGHRTVAAHLLIVHNPEGAGWAILAFCSIGMLAGYLWHNAEPSRMLMGDAGSRPLGLLVGIAVLTSGNPFLIIVAAPIILANGGTGLVKIALLRIFRLAGFSNCPPNEFRPARVLRRYRFPLHDHCRRSLDWSNAQVLMRFSLLQALLIPALLLLLLKLR